MIAKHEDSDGTGYCRGCGTTLGEEHHFDCELQDAARYRWLRDTDWWTDRVRDSLMDGSIGLDVAIDEAIAAMPSNA